MGHFGSSGSGSVFLMRIRIQLTKMNADPCGSRSATLGVWKILPCGSRSAPLKKIYPKRNKPSLSNLVLPDIFRSKIIQRRKSLVIQKSFSTLWSKRNKPSLQLINTNTTRSVLIFTAFRIRICLDADPGFFVTPKSFNLLRLYSEF